jgi:hypothetical protein
MIEVHDTWPVRRTPRGEPSLDGLQRGPRRLGLGQPSRLDSQDFGYRSFLWRRVRCWRAVNTRGRMGEAKLVLQDYAVWTGRR